MGYVVSNSDSAMTKEENTRMTINQITYGILISALVVANMMLVWSFGYILNFFERRGLTMLVKHKRLQSRM